MMDFVKEIAGKNMNARTAVAGKKKAKVFLEDNGLALAWETYNSTTAPDRYEENTIADVVNNLVKYGSLTPKQLSFLKNLTERVANRPAIEAARAAEKALAAPVPVTEERIKIEGEVVSVFYNRDFEKWDMTVKTVEGWTVKGSRPTGIEPEKGSKVEFFAKVKVAKNDPKHGYYSRPTKPKVL